MAGLKLCVALTDCVGELLAVDSRDTDSGDLRTWDNQLMAKHMVEVISVELHARGECAGHVHGAAWIDYWGDK
jgi:hypothetical protein